jgi:hypothetical protein
LLAPTGEPPCGVVAGGVCGVDGEADAGDDARAGDRDGVTASAVVVVMVSVMCSMVKGSPSTEDSPASPPQLH